MCVFSAVIKPALGNIIRKGGGMKKDIELLEELKGRLVEKMVIESRRTLVNTNVIKKCGEYIGALSNAIQMMKEAQNDTEYY